MSIDFYDATSEAIHDLNQTERQLFDYVIKNIEIVKYMSIQKFAAERFLSTTTIFRFTQKLGFSGYSDFINSLLVTSHSRQDTVMPDIVVGRGYSEEYLRNAMEAVRVMSPKQVEEVVSRLADKPSIYILTDDNSHTLGQYCERLFIGLGFHAYFPETAYQMQNLVNRIRGKDMILALSYSGRDTSLIDFIERVFLAERPYLLSVTRADNNALESLSDANFYVFADKILVPGMDLTSGVTMLMIVELLIYEYIAASKSSPE
ncbi:MAG: MurR/RpiR family transcriptional regulator [Oscillospiraceae bacterium]|nr:MurR/RpiR family transcriptional regulator [Oscillospiraceae bacterium]